MALLTIFLCLSGLSAWRVTRVLAARQPEPLTAIERGIWTAVLGLAIWLGQGWVLALLGRFNAGSMLVSSMLVLVASVAATRTPRLDSVVSPLPIDASLPSTAPAFYHVLPFALVALWLAYSAAALLAIPVSNHDALSYHFPKAAWLATTGAFNLYPSNDLRVTFFPDNYEMLAATVLAFVKSDRLTGLITSGSLLLYLATSYAFFIRVWQDRASSSLALVLMLGSPVLLLHSTAHKNDLLMAAFTLNALVWLGRYAARGGVGAATIGVLSLALSVGTKFHGLFLLVSSTILLWRAWRTGVWRPLPTHAVLQLAGVLAAILLLGGEQYVANLLRTGHLIGIIQVPTPNAMNTVSYPAFDQVPRFLWMFLAAPLLTAGQYFLVPWSGQTWFWPAYELYFSHYGTHVSVLILLLPFVVRRVRRSVCRDRDEELIGISVAALVLCAFNVLMGMRPYGGFAFIPRFLLFALPVLLAWTWCPYALYLRRIRPSSVVLMTASLTIPLAYIGMTVTHDAFAPIGYVARLWLHPEDRREIFHTNWRAATVCDRIAPADATVAVDAGYDGWTYPLFGAAISRKVEILIDRPGPYVPGPDVDWVVVDHAFVIIWGNPDFRTMADASRFINRGAVPRNNMRVFKSLTSNPEFKLVYYLPARFQAVFQRVRRAHS